MTETQARYVQYGAGRCAPPEWTNFDASPRLLNERLPIPDALLPGRKRLFPRNVRYGDIVRGLGIPPKSVRGVYASHVVECTPRANLDTALRNTLTMLEPGGVFRIVDANLQARAERYVAAVQAGDPAAADEFLYSLWLAGVSRSPGGFLHRARGLFSLGGHRWMYDATSLQRALALAGFVEIRECCFGDAEDPMFRLVEEEGRFLDQNLNQREVALEARAPRGPR